MLFLLLISGVIGYIIYEDTLSEWWIPVGVALMIAVATFPGIPIVINGISDPPITALFEVSDAMIPSTIPVPNFSGYFDALLPAE